MPPGVNPIADYKYIYININYMNRLSNVTTLITNNTCATKAVSRQEKLSATFRF